MNKTHVNTLIRVFFYGYELSLILSKYLEMGLPSQRVDSCLTLLKTVEQFSKVQHLNVVNALHPLQHLMRSGFWVFF